MWNSEFPGSSFPFLISIARPTQKMKRASWFLRVTPLLSGRAKPEIQSASAYLAKSEGTRRFYPLADEGESGNL
jgi:hypothetical protein